MAEVKTVQVLKDGEPELSSTVRVFLRSYKVLVPDSEEEYYANITYEERNYAALSEDLSGMLFCIDVDLDEVPEEHQEEVMNLIRKSLVLEGISTDELERDPQED